MFGQYTFIILLVLPTPKHPAFVRNARMKCIHSKCWVTCASQLSYGWAGGNGGWKSLFLDHRHWHRRSRVGAAARESQHLACSNNMHSPRNYAGGTHGKELCQLQPYSQILSLLIGLDLLASDPDCESQLCS